LKVDWKSLSDDVRTAEKRGCPRCDKVLVVRTYPRATHPEDWERWPSHETAPFVGSKSMLCSASRLTMSQSGWTRLPPDAFDGVEAAAE
jgi:hypothetical protein